MNVNHNGDIYQAGIGTKQGEEVFYPSKCFTWEAIFELHFAGVLATQRRRDFR